MRVIFLPGLILIHAFCNSQDIVKFEQIAGNQYNTLKFSLSVGNQCQILYDGSEIKQSLGKPAHTLEVGDQRYYNGKYGNAVSFYTLALDAFPLQSAPDQAKHLLAFGRGSFLNSILLVDVDKLSDDRLKIFCGAINTIGMMFHTRGKFVHAEKLLKYNLDLRAARFGKTSREYINSLHNLAVLKKDLGQYDEAERIFNYLVPTLKKLFTANSIQYIAVLNNKAMLLAELGRTGEAIKLLDEALGTGEGVLPVNYFDYERILTNRALIEQESGDLNKAEEIYKKVIGNFERKQFEDHPDYNDVLVNYGSLLVRKNAKSILPFLTELSVKVQRRYHEHPSYAKALSNIGNFYINERDYSKALAVFQKVGAMQKKLLGEKHRDYLRTLMKIGVCHWQLDNTAAAALQFRQAIDNYLFLLNSFFPSMSESEKSKFWSSLKPDIDTYTAFAADRNQTALLNEIYDLRLKTKGLLLNSANRTKEIILQSKDSTLLQLYSEWLEVKNLLSVYYNASPEELKEDKINLMELEQRANDLEKKLSLESSAFSAGYLQKEFSYRDVAGALRPKEAAVEIIRLQYTYGERKGVVEYIGLIAKEATIAPELIRLANGNLMETRYAAFYKNAIKTKSEDLISYNNYWSPFEIALKGFATVYVSVDGIYNSININTLQKRDLSYMLDKTNIVLVPSSKFIATASATEVALKSSTLALLIGAPEYGNPRVLPPLPGTRVEIENIDALLKTNQIQTNVFVGTDASEENLKAAEHPSVVHIATHGYFLSDVDLSNGLAGGVQVSKAKDNPLLRSGLMFRDAANAFRSEPMLSTSNNGVLTAYEAMSLDLADTDLVIMSACETGNGEIVNGEGVYGLARAFQVAGAKKIIMSLWKVDDTATEQLMTSFYRQWLISKNPHTAFLEAQRAVKKNFPEPYYWGAFVLLN